MARQPEGLGPGGGPLGLMCNEHRKTAPHWAQLNSQPPRCRRHFIAYTAHQSTMRSRKSRGQDTWPYDPGLPTPEDSGTLMLDHDELGYLISDLLGPINKARLAMYDARESGSTAKYQTAAEKLSNVAKTLYDWFDQDLRVDDIHDKGSRTGR